MLDGVASKLERTDGDYVVGGTVANGLTWLQVGEGDAIELVRLQHFTSPATEPSMSLVVDVCAAGLADAATYSHGGRPLSSPAPSQPLPPPAVQRIADTPAAQSLASYIPLHPFLDQNKGIWNAGGEAAFESAMSAGRELHEKGKGGSCGGCGGGRASHGIAWEANPIKGMNGG